MAVEPKYQSYLHPPGWKSYWSVGSKPGYCGVVIFIKEDSAWFPPLAIYTDAEMFRDDEEDGMEIGKEGRLVVADMGAFVLFGVYVPNISSPERIPFKRKFVDALYKQSK